MEGEIFIIRSGSGYLVKIENNVPFMTTNRKEATEYKGSEVLEILGYLTILGYDAQLIHIPSDEDKVSD